MFLRYIVLFVFFGGSSSNFLFPDNEEYRSSRDIFSSRHSLDEIHKPVEDPFPFDGSDDGEDDDPCVGKDYCEFPNNYPDREILAKVEYELKKNEILRLFLRRPKTEFGLGLRNGFDEYDYEMAMEEPKNVCSMKSENIRPRKHQNIQGKDRFIVNSPNGRSEYTQEITVGVCRGKDAMIRSRDELLADSAGTKDECGQGSTFEGKTECFQEFLAHKLLAVDLDSNEIVLDEFYFPSCCVCKVINLEN